MGPTRHAALLPHIAKGGGRALSARCIAGARHQVRRCHASGPTCSANPVAHFAPALVVLCRVPAAVTKLAIGPGGSGNSHSRYGDQNKASPGVKRRLSHSFSYSGRGVRPAGLIARKGRRRYH